MKIRKQFWGYDCSEVEAFLLDLEEKKRLHSREYMTRCINQNQKNRETLNKIHDLSVKLAKKYLQESEIKKDGILEKR